MVRCSSTVDFGGERNRPIGMSDPSVQKVETVGLYW